MADVSPFRALRYDEAKAGPLADLVAPPYDVISPEQRAELAARSPYNVVHLTLPESEVEAARAIAEWRREGVLREDEPAAWVLTQDYVGPDGVARTRTGLVASLRVEPYRTSTVLPHERTHRGPREGRQRLLEAVGVQLEPIFLLYDGPAVTVPDAPPELAVEGARLWRLGDVPIDLSGTQLLIADGHHRYETAVWFAERGGSAQMPVVLVPTSDPGLTIFPTHRIVERLAKPPSNSLLQGMERPEGELPGLVLYRAGEFFLVEGDDELDVQLVERFAPEGVTYTPDLDEAIARVDAGAAEAAFLVRAPSIEQVFELARRGEVMPQKTTYFFPKLLSGLLFHPA